MTVYSKQLGAGVVSGGATVTVLTAAANPVVELREITITPSTAAGSNFSVFAVAPGGVTTTIWAGTVGSTPVSVYRELRDVLAAGEALKVYSSTAAIQYRISGYELGG